MDTSAQMLASHVLLLEPVAAWACREFATAEMKGAYLAAHFLMSCSLSYGVRSYLKQLDIKSHLYLEGWERV